MKKNTKSIRNIAVIAHVDHGKTTLVDALLKQTHVFRENQKEMLQERILDSNILERERGITILAKNCAISFKGVKINIIDTPGHADFSGEVERTLGMADGALLIVDAAEGPMPQTRFVLRKALELGLKVIVVINKIDKKYARISFVEHKVESLFLELAKTEAELEFSVLYAVGREGKVFDKIHQGEISLRQKIVLSTNTNSVCKVQKLYVSEGLIKKEVEKVSSGDIVFVAGIEGIKIGDTICDPLDTHALPLIEIGEPTIHITLGANTSAFSGREGKYSTGRQLEERLEKELEKNLSLRMERKVDGKFKVSGRGELHLAILLENLRREGYEMEVEKPQVIVKEIEGEKYEPVEEVDIVVPTEFVGVINQEFGKRYAVLKKMEPLNEKETEFIYTAPTRVLIGLRSLLMSMTKGTLLFSSFVVDYQPLGKAIPKMRNGALIATQTGDALSYGLHAAQQRGITYIPPGTKVYEGMIVGKNAKEDDISVNVCKGKKLTNMRSKSSDGIIQLAPHVELSLEQCLDFIGVDELLEITPLSLRLRKKHLTELDRKRVSRKFRYDFAS